MAMQVQAHFIGVDTSKLRFDIDQSWSSDRVRVENDSKPIERYLKGLKALDGPVCIAIEATNTYHVEFVEIAYKLGYTVYVIDGLRLKHYRESIGGRAKTDASDARLLRRYLEHEREYLRPWSPPPKAYAKIQRLLRRRAKLVQTKTQLRQCFSGLRELKSSTAALVRHMDRLDALLQKHLRSSMKSVGWWPDVQRCRAIEGVGPVTAMALTLIFHREQFTSSDAFIAFLGMDVRVRESGKFVGRRKLTKKGDPELRRLLYMAAMTACRSMAWKPFYERALARGLSRIQALVALGRKLARIGYALLKNQSTYRPKITQETCVAT